MRRGVFDERVDRVVGERRQLDRLPVAVPAVRDERVEHRLQRGVELRLEQVDDRVAELLQRPHHLDPVLRRAGVAGPDHHDRLAVHVLGQEGERRGHAQLEDRRQLVGRRGDELAVEGEHLAGILEGVKDRPGEHDRSHRVKPVLERGHDAEVPAAAADPPEEVGVLIPARGEELALRRHQVDREEVVDRRAVLSHEPADAAAEGEARDAGVGDDPAHRRQAVKLRLAVELAPEHAGLGPGGARRRVDPDPLHRRKVDHEAAVAERMTTDAVAAGAHRHK